MLVFLWESFSVSPEKREMRRRGHQCLGLEGKDRAERSTGIVFIDCTVMINPLSMGHLVLGLEGVWDNWLNETRALASWGSQLTVQKTPLPQ